MLTKMQRRYVWLAGSFPHLTVAQGRGRRTIRTLYGIDESASELHLFGYGTPLFFLSNKGLFKKLQDWRLYALTDNGEAEFRKLLAGGGVSSDEFLRVEILGIKSA